MEPAPPADIPAATVVVFRRGADGAPPQILMITRSKAMTFAGGMAVFPGGRVDGADRNLAEAARGGLDSDEAAHRIAAIRETLEEAGLVIGVAQRASDADARAARAMLLDCGELEPVLDRFGWTLDLAALIPFARWHPQNERLPRVFDTRFYLADLGTGAVELEIDATENTRLFWTGAEEALAMAERGEIALIYPTRRNLERLAQFASFEEARAHAEAIPVQKIVPRMVERGGEPWLVIPADAGYPVDGERLQSAMRA
jgi:8-oxo-dGTP pyrophosphatase MutT (NUDIX family)